MKSELLPKLVLQFEVDISFFKQQKVKLVAGDGIKTEALSWERTSEISRNKTRDIKAKTARCSCRESNHSLVEWSRGPGRFF